MKLLKIFKKKTSLTAVSMALSVFTAAAFHIPFFSSKHQVLTESRPLSGDQSLTVMG